MKKGFIITFIFAVIIALSAYVYFRPVQSYTIRIADAQQPAFALVYLADELGYFKQEGITVQYSSFTSGKDALDAVLAGDADLATVFDTPVVIQSLNGNDIAVITELHRASRNIGIVARKNAGIDSVSDLSGKKIAVTVQSGGEFFAHIILSEAQIRPNQVTWVSARPEDMVSLLQNSEVDAIATWNPHILNAVNTLGEDAVVTFFTQQAQEMSVLAGLNSYVSEHPEAIQAVLKALISADRYLEKNPDAGRALIYKKFSNLDQNSLKNILSSTVYSIQLSNTLYTLLNEESVWFHIQRGQNSYTDLKEVLYTDILEHIEPARVTVF